MYKEAEREQDVYNIDDLISVLKDQCKNGTCDITFCKYEIIQLTLFNQLIVNNFKSLLAFVNFGDEIFGCTLSTENTNMHYIPLTVNIKKSWQ